MMRLDPGLMRLPGDSLAHDCCCLYVLDEVASWLASAVATASRMTANGILYHLRAEKVTNARINLVLDEDFSPCPRRLQPAQERPNAA